MVAAAPKDGCAPVRSFRLTRGGFAVIEPLPFLPDQKETIVKILPQPVPGSGPLKIGPQVRAGGSDLGGSEVVPGTSTQTTRLVLRIVAEQAGPEGVSRVLGHAGLRDQQVALRTVGGRISYSDKIRLFDAAAAELGDPRLGLRLGPAAMKDPAAAPLRVLARAFGSPAALIRRISRLSTRFDTACVLRCEWVQSGAAVVGWKALPPHQPSRADCDYTIGLLAQIPVVFGLPPARVDHGVICQLNGAPECIYKWPGQYRPVSRLRNMLRRFTGAERGRQGAHPRSTGYGFSRARHRSWSAAHLWRRCSTGS